MTDEATQPAEPRHNTWPPFESRVFQRQLALDALARRAVLVLLFGGIFADWVVGQASSLPEAAVILAAVGWVGISVVSSRAARAIGQFGAMLESSPAAAESTLAGALERWPLQRGARLSLYYRLAVLRHHQHRFAEAANIARTLLTERLGTVERSRVDLLVILIESSLRCGDLTGAFLGIDQMHKRRLSMFDQLRLLALQTRYEVACGYHANAVSLVDKKVRMAELLPAPLAGHLHAMLATSAAAAHQPVLADWLQRRADLLATPEQMDALLGLAPTAAMSETT